jgi:hypothetical protein
MNIGHSWKREGLVMFRNERGRGKKYDDLRDKEDTDLHYSDKGGHYARSPKRAETLRAIERALWQERIKLPRELRESAEDEWGH